MGQSFTAPVQFLNEAELADAPPHLILRPPTSRQNATHPIRSIVTSRAAQPILYAVRAEMVDEYGSEQDHYAQDLSVVPANHLSASHLSLSDTADAKTQHRGSKSVKTMMHEIAHEDGPVLRHLHEHKLAAPASIPEATIDPRWKAPYAYGYFGASGSKHWKKSSGYRDTYKRWSYQ